MKFLSVRAIPNVSWSSIKPLNFRPSVATVSMLCIGLLIFGVGEALLIAAGAGVSPWIVLSQGISTVTDWSIGLSTFVVSIAVLILWIPLKQVPGIGTLLNVIIIAVAMELLLPYLPQPGHYLLKLLQAISGILLVGIGSGIYLIANLGPGPRDGLMTGLQRISNLPVAAVRASIEISVVVLGWLLGGVVGLGTLLFAFGIGPAVSIALFLVHKFSSKAFD